MASLSIAQNTALFRCSAPISGATAEQPSVCQTCGRTPVGASFSNPPGLTPVSLGEKSGAEQDDLAQPDALHSHRPDERYSLDGQYRQSCRRSARQAGTVEQLQHGGCRHEYGSQHGHRRNRRGSQPMAIRNPYTGLLFCIAAEGIFPSRP